jgi:hypothetical protein
MVKQIELLEDNEELNQKKGAVITVYEFLATKLIDEKKAKYVIIKKSKEGDK